jgi:serine phosphatase RsbU (regulator of sigma subunit)
MSNRRRRWPFGAAVVVLVVGLLATGLLTWLSYGSYTRNETHLLRLRARDIGTVLTAALPGIQTPLASAAALADATHANRKKFRRFVAPYIGTGPGRLFASVSLWRVSAPQRGPVAVIGGSPSLASSPRRAERFIARTSRTSTLAVIGMLGRHPPRLGYGFTGAVPGPFVAYGESALPKSRYSPVQRNSAFSDVNYAIYLGRTPRPANLVVANTRRLPLAGQRATVRVPFGSTFFTVTIAARGPQAGVLPQLLPLAIAIVGVLLTLGATMLAASLIRRRRNVERLAEQLERTAEENRQLFAQQRSIAQTLQHALLPDVLPQVPGLQASASYQAGAEGVDIGGDWYDLIPLPDGRLLLVVGDVSGRGLKAATTMASLRFAIHAYTAQGDEPPAILRKLSGLVSVSADRQLATVLCALIDVGRREISVTNAGHLPLLMVSAKGAQFVESDIGLPVAVDPAASYRSTTVSAPPGAILLAFTDGLVERRGESIDVGLERLRAQVSPDHVALDQLLERLLHDVRDDESDDAAIAAIRWTS